LGLRVFRALAALRVLFLVDLLIFSHWSTSDVHDFAVGLEETHLARRAAALRLEELEAHAIALARGRVHQHHVRDRDRHLLVDDSAGLPLHRIRPLALLPPVHAFHEDLALGEYAKHGAALALVLAGGD